MSFRTAISGIRSATADLSTIGNNVANANTTGFKQSRTEFADVFASSSTGVSSNATGQGVNTSRVAQQFTQGNITFTDNNLDLAISGNGFFVVDDNGAQLYSRDGAFGIDRDGFVVNSNSQKLKAFGSDSTGAINGTLGPLRISTANTSPRATSLVNFGANLDSQETVPTIGVFDPANNSSFNSTTATTVYDSLGGSPLLQLYFVKTGDGAWNLHSYVDGNSVGGTVDGTGAPLTVSNPLTFNSAGALATPATGLVTLPDFTPAGGGSPISLSLNVTEMTQYGAPFGVNRVTQDGYTTGRLASVDIDATGTVFARYTNGQSSVQGQVALANFPNPQGLRSLGRNNWAETFEAGAVLVGAPSTASLGTIQSGALEDSNIDLSEQLVKLIVAQRNFQANTQVIQAEDQANQAIINIR